jgi:hypothetical protein
MAFVVALFHIDTSPSGSAVELARPKESTKIIKSKVAIFHVILLKELFCRT